MSRSVDPDELSAAVVAWIRAEWQFRCGPYAFNAPTDLWLLEAEDNLRRVLTGYTTLDRAHAVLRDDWEYLAILADMELARSNQTSHDAT